MLRNSLLTTLVLAVVFSIANVNRATAQNWPEVTKADWELTDDPANPGASAIILYREVDTDDKNAFTNTFYRIKVLKDEGKKYADVEIPFYKGSSRIQDIRARTLHPNGQTTDFDGTVYEREVVKARGVKYLAKTFTLPDVQTGSIIEYSYTERWDKIEDWVFRSPDAAFIFSQFSPMFAERWMVQDDLFTKRAHFSFKPLPFALGWTWANLQGQGQPASHKGLVEYDATNVPGFKAEDYIPPEESLKGRVEFYYIFKEAPKNAKDTKWYWQDLADKRAKDVEQFIGKDKSFTKAVDFVGEDSDSPEVKLRRIYTRVQQIRNLSYEPEKTEKEEKRQKIAENNSASEVVKHGFGWGNEINEVFVGMARAAGFDAAMVYVAPRNARFFNPSLLDWSQLSAEIVVVHLNGKDRYFDPASKFCPYGLIPWEEDTTTGFRLDKDGAAEVKVPPGASSDTVISRKGTVELNEEGGAKGSFELSFTGQDALERRRANRDRDEAGRRKALEDELKQSSPSGTTVEVGDMTGWDKPDEPLKVRYTVETEGTMQLGVNRLLFPAVPFPGEVKYFFQSASRSLPVYITYPYEELDDLTLALPKSMRVESVPSAKNNQTGFGDYSLSIENHGTSVHILRHFTMQEGLVPAQYYPQLRGFLATVRQADETRLVFRSDSSAHVGGDR
ncbi:MAG: hypothetical protein DMG21_15600 [Acidobacteria bacterium]|nr:MAG: hypothetical protein DMG21_15600 [Acidobacteriota bacterium]